MPDLTTVLTSALVAAVVSGVIGPLLLFFLHRGEDRRRQGFEVRFREYTKYLLSLEDMSSLWEEKAMGFLRNAKANFEAILREEGDPTKHLVNLHNSLAGLTTELLSSFAPIKKDLTGLR